MSASGVNTYMKPVSQEVKDSINERVKITAELRTAANNDDVIKDACEKISTTLRETITELSKQHTERLSKTSIRLTFLLGSRDSTVNTCFSTYWEKVRSITCAPVHSDLISTLNLVFLRNIAEQAKNLSDYTWYSQTEIGTVRLFENEVVKNGRYIEVQFLTIYIIPQSDKPYTEVPLHSEGHVSKPHEHVIYDIAAYKGRKTRITAGLCYTNILPNFNVWAPDSAIEEIGEYLRKQN